MNGFLVTVEKRPKEISVILSDPFEAGSPVDAKTKKAERAVCRAMRTAFGEWLKSATEELNRRAAK